MWVRYDLANDAAILVQFVRCCCCRIRRHILMFLLLAIHTYLFFFIFIRTCNGEDLPDGLFCYRRNKGLWLLLLLLLHEIYRKCTQSPIVCQRGQNVLLISFHFRIDMGEKTQRAHRSFCGKLGKNFHICRIQDADSSTSSVVLTAPKCNNVWVCSRASYTHWNLGSCSFPKMAIRFLRKCRLLKSSHSTPTSSIVGATGSNTISFLQLSPYS
mmetsp:Transcript_7895/g.12565  ORF Transcript_7895/g.12565 Transcript_7895/m.12565 type:complete len:213 (+) Transcript_7895:772-1410(+)